MDNLLQWQPTASVDCLIERAAILSKIRAYFAEQKVLEVETPTIAPNTITDINLEAMSTLHTNPNSVKKTHLYLQTSPEYYMKRLLCCGFPSIYQISKCYRDDEVGRYHNPEFTMLEWYRLAFTMDDIIDDVDRLLQLVLRTPVCEKQTYTDLFKIFLDFNVQSDSDAKLIAICQRLGYGNLVPPMSQKTLSGTERDGLLQLLFSEKIEQHIGLEKPIAVTHFPASQASLAKIDPSSSALALRFEFYFKGIELANGFEELSNPLEQKARFDLDNSIRKSKGLPPKPVDMKFLRALEEDGLPNCSGVALGIDRLLMLALEKQHIRDVLSFDFESL